MAFLAKQQGVDPSLPLDWLETLLDFRHADIDWGELRDDEMERRTNGFWTDGVISLTIPTNLTSDIIS